MPRGKCQPKAGVQVTWKCPGEPAWLQARGDSLKAVPGRLPPLPSFQPRGAHGPWERHSCPSFLSEQEELGAGAAARAEASLDEGLPASRVVRRVQGTRGRRQRLLRATSVQETVLMALGSSYNLRA